MKLHHPNSHLPEDTVELGLNAAAGAFRRCNLNPRRPPDSQFDCNSLIYGELGKRRFLAYIRITLEEETEEGTGPMPPLLIDAAAELGAEPHLIRVHMRRVGEGTGFAYFGYDEFIQSVLSNTVEWNARLIAPKTFSDYVSILKGRRSRLHIDLDFSTTTDPESKNSETTVELKLSVDGKQPYSGTIDPGCLLRSTTQGDEYDIFTCTCGVAGCAGIWRGVIVVHEGDLTLWKAFYAEGRRVFLFEKEQYKAEILSKCGEAIAFVRSGEDRYVIPYTYNFSSLEETYYRATESLPEPGVSHLSYTATPKKGRLDSI